MTLGQPRLYLDGTYVCAERAAGAFIHTEPVISQANLPDHYEISFDSLNSEGWYPDLDIAFPESDKSELDLDFDSEMGVTVVEYDTKRRLRRLSSDPRNSWKEKLKIRSSQMNVRVFVDSVAGRIRVFFDGILVGDTGAKPIEKLEGAAKSFELSENSTSFAIFSNVRVAPWSGQFPIEESDRPSVLLSNADSIAGEIKEIKDGKLEIASDAGPLEIPISEVLAVTIPGTAQPAARAVVRLRLNDGSVVNADAFHWDGDDFLGHDSILGDLRIPGNAIDEIVLDPSPLRSPHALLPGLQ
jgi:hypothetical protein